MGTLTRTACLLLLLASVGGAQPLEDFLIHKRGTLHQTVFVTGELGRKYVTSNANTELGIPSFEWPGNSATIVDGKQYTGWHNSYGGGVQISADRVDSTLRLVAYCGGQIDAVSKYVNSFPLSLERFENFPVLADGSLNPSYNPDEAEEKIVARWATPVGVTITRTSRAWSFPDYDDFIIYEYEFENTGDMDGIASTPARPVLLKDLVIVFNYGLTGGKFGYNRTGGSWNNSLTDEINMYGHYDQRRWLLYGTHRTGNPEPTYFAEWAATGKNGGGLLSPQAPGFMALYVDTVHGVRRGDGTRVQVLGSDSVAWDENGHIKQPYYLRQETSQARTDKVWPNALDITQVRKSPLAKDSTVWGTSWVGRPQWNWRQGMRIGANMGYGPYHLPPGEKVHITLAEVCGYGAARLEETLAGVKDIGGSNGANPPDAELGDALYAYNIVPNYWVPKTRAELNPTGASAAYTRLFGSDYLSNYPLPDYVNSNVITIREVADRAIQAYTGDPLVDYDSTQYWPETRNEDGVYRFPIPVPAPAITMENTLVGENRVVWGPQVETFTTARLQGTFDHYELYKSTSGMGPWTKLATIAKGDPAYFVNGKYQYVDKNSRIGDYFYYSVVSVDNNGNKSGRTNITLHQSSIGAASKLSKVFVAPNPFIISSGQAGESVGGDINSQLRFYNLPRTCTIRIFSYSGQLIQTIEHDENKINHPYFQITRNNQLIASGVYFYVVDAPDGTRVNGKFVIIN